MAYLALYRVWRPGRFDEVVGQEQTVTALRNAVKTGQLSHAYLFSGPRGTGKTSIAKILAKAVNCENVVEGEPCNQCSTCRDINNSNFMDVIEIDAASNRGIDEIRDLRARVRILPAQGKKKVYIIDEVHMLTTEAFNALLKTLEEPPDSVIFILATTEAQKIPATILSRCQNYNFRRLTLAEISQRLQQVADSNDIDLEEAARDLIARRANGGMRDALSLLDQVHSYKGHKITGQDVMSVLGLVDENFMARLINAVLTHEIAEVVGLLNQALVEGKEALQIVREASLYIRDLMFYRLLGEDVLMSYVSETGKKYLKQQKDLVSPSDLMKALKVLMGAGEKLKFSEGQKFLLEMSFMEITALFAPHEEAKKAPPERKAAAAPEPKERKDALEGTWNKILAGVKEVKIPTHALLCQGKLLGARGDSLYIGFKKGYKFHKERLEENPNREIVEGVVKEIFGKNLDIQFIFLDDNQYNDIIVKRAIEYFGEDIVEIKD
ncbi:MAG TPA: DNA polymerase III subunit gamma/tau [Syntrophomonas sp.]|jgi:DNA polymerase-3 subunit gamma/tau|nr:DNA polymerase III subunit gamma/tau [Syntrophomonas sp.]